MTGIEKDISDNSHLFEGNIETSLELYRALCGNTVIKGNESYTFPWKIAAEIASDVYNQISGPTDFYLSGKEGVVTKNIRSLLADLGWEIELL